MYGLVNKAIAEMVVAQKNEAAWKEITMRVGLETNLFEEREGYYDEITFQVIGAAGKVLGQSPQQILEATGEHWIDYVRAAGFDHYFDSGGKTLADFLINLPFLYDRAGLILPHLQTLEFWVTDIRMDSLRLHYQSSIPGFAPMVIGFLRGFGKRFKTQVSVYQLNDRLQGYDHDEFLVEFESPNADLSIAS